MKKRNSLVAARIAAHALIAAHDLSLVVKWAAVVATWLQTSIDLISGMDVLRVHADGQVRVSHGGKWERLSEAFYEPPKGGWKLTQSSEKVVFPLAGLDPPVHPTPRNEGCTMATGCGGRLPSRNVFR